MSEKEKEDNKPIYTPVLGLPYHLGKQEFAKAVCNHIRALIEISKAHGIVIDVDTVYNEPLAMGNFEKLVSFRETRYQEIEGDVAPFIPKLIEEINNLNFTSWGNNGHYLITIVNDKNIAHMQMLVNGEQYRYIQRKLSEAFNPPDDQ